MSLRLAASWESSRISDRSAQWRLALAAHAARVGDVGPKPTRPNAALRERLTTLRTGEYGW